jgi:hypothetical protein
MLGRKDEALVPVIGSAVLEFVTGNGGDDDAVGRILPEEGFPVPGGVVVDTIPLAVVEGATTELGGAPGPEAPGSETEEAVGSAEEGSEDVNHGSTPLVIATEVALNSVEFPLHPVVEVREDPVEFQLETDIGVDTGVFEMPLVMLAVGSMVLVDRPGTGAAEPVLMTVEPIGLEVKVEI